MKQFKQVIQEGVYDPGIFKAFFLAGGPGSGKTYVTNRATGGMGLKLVNSDTRFERYLTKAGLSLKMPDKEAALRDPLRARAKQITGDAMDIYIRGRLGLVIDATGRDYNIISKQKSLLQMLGYDCYMIFVNTSLEVALERNRTRTRRVPEDITKKSWQAVQNNIGKFQTTFGRSNFIVVDNNNAREDILNKLWTRVRGLVRAPVRSIIAKRWMQIQLDIKKQDKLAQLTRDAIKQLDKDIKGRKDMKNPYSINPFLYQLKQQDPKAFMQLIKQRGLNVK